MHDCEICTHAWGQNKGIYTYTYVHWYKGVFTRYGLTMKNWRLLSDRYVFLKAACMLGFFILVQAPPSSGMFSDHTQRMFRSTWVLKTNPRKKLSKIVNREWRPVGSNPHRLFVRYRCILSGSTHYPFAVQPTVGVLDLCSIKIWWLVVLPIHK